MLTRIAPVPQITGPIGDGVTVPTWLIRDANLGSDEKMLYLMVLLEAGEEDAEGPPSGSVESLALSLKWSPDRVREHLRALVARRLVKEVAA